MKDESMHLELTLPGGNMRFVLTSETTFMVSALRFFRRSLGFLFAASIALSGCASKPAYQYQWRATANSDHIPDGLLTAPHVIAGDQPITLANLGDDDAMRRRDEQRQRAIGGGVAGGAAEMGFRMLLDPRMLIMCIVPPLCIGAIAVGGAIGGATAASKNPAPWLSLEDAAGLAAVFNEHATNMTLQKRVSNASPRVADQQDFPRLVVRLEAVEFLMDGNDVVSFELKAQAQAFPAPDVEWKPTEHVVRFPSRRAKVWLASDGKFLLSTLDTALDTLSASIVSVYLPEGKRISSSQERSPLVDALGSNATESSSGLMRESQ